MTVCEMCGSEIARGSEKSVEIAKVLSAVQMGYDPLGRDQTGRPTEQLREHFGLLLEMHDPVWILCLSCCDAIESYAAQKVLSGPRSPELIRILGNGFLPKPQQWRIMLGAWLDKWEEKGVKMTTQATLITIEESPKASLEEFIDIIPKQSEQYPGQLVDHGILRDPESNFEMVLLAIWSLKDSPAMRKMMQKP